MPGFLGRYEFQIDEKGRVSLPSAYRKAASEDPFVVLLQWEDAHLALLPGTTWAEIQRRLLEYRRGGKREAQAAYRKILANAVDIEVDKQGRIRIPERLREAVGLESTVLLLGALDRVELWSPEAFKGHMEEDDADFTRYASQIFG